MVVSRVSNSEKQAQTLNEIESKFIAGVERQNLKSLTLDELAHRFDDIEQQGQLLQGMVLLEARTRFDGDKEFGKWRASSLWACSASQCTRLIQLARYFGNSKPLEKISITAAYEISAPANADIADEIYNYAKGRNLPVAEVKRQIAIRKGESLPLPTKPTEPATNANIPSQLIPTDKSLIAGNQIDNDEIVEKSVGTIEESTTNEAVKIEIETDLKAKLYADIGSTPPFDVIRVLQEMINEIRGKVYGK